MVRRLAMLLALSLWLAAPPLLALGLGNVVLDSSLNRPLDARIQVIDLGNVQPDQISVTLAAPADFRRFNIDRIAFLNYINVEVESGSGGVFVHLTTAQSVREPYLSLVLDTRWPSGRLLSEHTMLLDLPVFNESAVPATVIQPATPVPDRSVPSGPETVTTLDSDTLATVAERVRPDPSVSTQQTMLAIQRLNPDAFDDGNTDRLRSGQVLRIPDLSEIRSIDQQQALAEVARQNQMQVPVAVEPVAPVTEPVDPVAGGGRLSVLTAEDASAGAGSTGDQSGAELDARISALEVQLALREEEVDRVRIQREELMSRLDDLEIQIAAAMEIIALQDSQLASLQESLADAARQAELTPAANPVAVDGSQSGLAGRLLDSLTGNAVAIVLGVALLVALLVMILLRRGRLHSAGAEEHLAGLAGRSEPVFGSPARVTREPVPVQVPTKGAGKAKEQQDIENELNEILNLTREQDQAESETTEDFDDLDLPDPYVGELLNQADRLLAQGQADEAAAALVRGVAEYPDNVDLQLKLLEAFAEQKDRTAFSHLAEQLGQLESEEIAVSISVLRRKLGEGATERQAAGDIESIEFNPAKATDSDLSLDDFDLEDEMDFLSADDEITTKLELAYAYEKMGDSEGARDILQEVIREGNEGQKNEARALLQSLNLQSPP